MKNAPATVQEAGRGEQLTLLPELEIIPTRPNADTLAGCLLGMLAAGDALTHPEFEERTGSWRLAAVAFELQALGWAVESVRIPAPTADRPDRSIARYRLAANHRALAAGGTE